MAYFQTTDWGAKLRLLTDLETHKQEQAQNLKQKIRDTKQAMAGKIPPGKGGSPGQPYQPPQPTGPYVPAPPREVAGGASFDIDPAAHKKVNKGAKMHNKTRGNPSDKEVEMIKKMMGGPQLPLAQVDYTSPHPKFDQHMKNTPPLSQPKDRIDHLKKGVTIRKA